MTEQTLTPAEELRAAASKIREAIGVGIRDIPWRADGVEIMGEFTFVAEIRHLNREEAGMAAQYFALWHPGVAELVAAWLDAVAVMWEGLIRDAEAWKFLRHESRDELRSGPWDARHALSLARAINGGAR